MSFQIYGDGKTGEVFVEDQRPDGSVVLLVCSPRGDRPSGYGGGPGSDDPVGVVTASTPDGGAFPLLSESRLVNRRLPRLHLDTTDMPGGVLRFLMSRFVRTSLATAERGIREVRLRPGEARDWGWIPDEPTHPDGDDDGDDDDSAEPDSVYATTDDRPSGTTATAAPPSASTSPVSGGGGSGRAAQRRPPAKRAAGGSSPTWSPAERG